MINITHDHYIDTDGFEWTGWRATAARRIDAEEAAGYAVPPVRKLSAASWITATEFEGWGNGLGTLTITKNDGASMRWEGVPAFLPGLIHAGACKAANGRRSPGATLNRLLRGVYRYTAIEAPFEEPPAGQLLEQLTASLQVAP